MLFGQNPKTGRNGITAKCNGKNTNLDALITEFLLTIQDYNKKSVCS